MKIFRTILLPAVLLLGMTLPGLARAKALEVFVQPQTGGLFGIATFDTLPWGDANRQLNTEEDYFLTHKGPNVGASMGIEFMFIDVVLDVNQFYRSDHRSTLFNFMVGLDADFPISPTSVWTIYLFGGFGIGTIDNAWIEKEQIQVAKDDLYAQIFFLRAGLRYEYKFTEMIRLAVDAGLGVHLLTLAYKAVNEDDAQAAGVHAYVTGGLRFYWDFFGKKESDDVKDTSLPEAKPAPAAAAPATPAPVTPAPAAPATTPTPATTAPATTATP